MCSSSLQAMHVNEIGRMFEGSERFPDFGTGVTLLIFQSFGIKPVSGD